MAEVTALRPGIGHNSPPPDNETVPTLDTATLRALLTRDYADLMRRFVELEQGARRLPEEIGNEAEAQRLLDFVAHQCRPLIDEAQTAHDDVKRPYLQCGRIVDQFFLRRIEAFKVVLVPVSKRAENFLKRKRVEQRAQEDEQRRRAAEDKRKAEAEAERLAAAAREAEAHNRAEAAELGRQAEVAQAAAAAAAAIVEAPGAPVRLHGEYGATAYTKEQWTYTIADPTEIPLAYLMPDDDAIRAAIARGIRAIPGIDIHKEERFTIRRG